MTVDTKVTSIPAGAKYRPHMSAAVKIKALLLALGFNEDDVIEWDHQPALALRAWDTEAGDTIPPANDPRYIVPLRKDDHRIKTFGTGATTRGADAGDIAHFRRLVAKEAEFQARRLAKDRGDPPPPSRKPKRRWPTGRPIQSANNLRSRPSPRS